MPRSPAAPPTSQHSSGAPSASKCARFRPTVGSTCAGGSNQTVCLYAPLPASLAFTLHSAFEPHAATTAPQPLQPLGRRAAGPGTLSLLLALSASSPGTSVYNVLSRSSSVVFPARSRPMMRTWGAVCRSVGWAERRCCKHGWLLRHRDPDQSVAATNEGTNGQLSMSSCPP